MLQLNHINLSTTDVPGLSDFFERCLQFQVVERRGNNNFAFLEAADGFSLILMHDKTAASGYPAMFHIGFIVPDQETVHTVYRRMIEAGYDTPEPKTLRHGANAAFGLYYTAPGGILVEISAHPTASTRP